MATKLRTVLSLSRLTCSSRVLATRVWCVISKPNDSFRDQGTYFCKSKSASGFSTSANFPAPGPEPVSVCPLPTRLGVGVSEQPIQAENLSPAPDVRTETIEQLVEPLPRSFLTESVNGNLVECSARGSRPLFSNVLAEFQASFSQGAILATADPNAVKKAFHDALLNAPTDAHLLSQFAMFTWKVLGDLDAAEKLFNKALELAPDDPDIQANHALFLWQFDS